MIEKKIGSKLLFVFLTCFASLLFSFLLFPVSSKAANNYDNLVSDLSGIGFHFANNTVKNYWEDNPNKNIYVSYTTNNAYIYFGDNLTYTEGNPNVLVNYDEYGYNLYKSDGIADWTHFNTFSQVGKAFLCYYVGLGGIDWDNPFYSANIKAPSVNVTYRELTSVPTVDVPLNVSVEDYNDFYFESFAIFCVPTTLAVTVNQGQYVYDGFNVSNLRYNLVEAQDLKKPSDYSVDSFHLLINDGWYNRQLPDSAFDFLFPTGSSSSFQDSARNKYMNLRKNMCMGGNQIYLYFRYFTVIDNQFVVGPWRIWTSYDPSSFNEEVPDYIQPYLPAVGTTGTTTEVNPAAGSTPEPTQIYNPSSTGQNINIEVKQNVPNYPDYPTIASYNKDNLLVDTINSLNSFTLFFGDFGLFLTTAFGFIPEWIWGIIGVGFSLSIIVMFLKIL